MVTTSAQRLVTPVAAAAVALAALLAAAGTFLDNGENRAREYLFVLGLVALAATAVFGFVVPKALARERRAGVALALSLLGLASVAAFWSGVPPVLAGGGALLGWAGRDARRGRTASLVALAIGGFALAADVWAYVGDVTGWF